VLITTKLHVYSLSLLGVLVCIVRAPTPFFFLIQRCAALLRVREKKKIHRRSRKQCSATQALNNRRWVEDIKGTLTIQVTVDYLHIWLLRFKSNFENSVLPPPPTPKKKLISFIKLSTSLFICNIPCQLRFRLVNIRKL